MMMKKILFSILLLISYINADLVDDGMLEYHNGNKQKASELFRKACDAGNANGCYKLGMLFYHGEGVRQNKQEALNLFKQACDAGNEKGCSNLGILFYYGDGVIQDKQLAKELFGEACDDGKSDACNNYKIINKEDTQ